jgi:hypothetical protein
MVINGKSTSKSGNPGGTMKHVSRVEEAVNASTIPSGSRLYCSGNAATPQALLKQIAADESIRGIELLGVLLLGDIEALFS